MFKKQIILILSNKKVRTNNKMVQHIVFFKIKNSYNAAQKKEAIKEIMTALSELPKKIEEILYFEVAENQAERPNNSDIVLISEFKNFESLNIYQKHKVHLDVIEIIKQHKEYSTYVDFENNFSKFLK